MPEKKLRANVLQAIGDVQQFRQRTDAALQSYDQALALSREIGDHLGEANVLASLSRLALAQEDLAAAERQLKETLALRRALQDTCREGADLFNFSLALLNAGQPQKALAYARRARAVFEQVGEPHLLQQTEALIAACQRAAESSQISLDDFINQVIQQARQGGDEAQALQAQPAAAAPDENVP